MVSILDSRQAVILTALLEANQSQSVRKLAQQVNLSERVVRYNLPMVSAWLADHNAELVICQRVGIRIEAKPEHREQLRADLAGKQFSLVMSPTDRLHVLIFHLLTSQEGFSAKDWQNRLGISHATLARDLEQVQNRLEEFHLYLKRKSKLGTIVAGREIDVRHATISLILREFSEVDLLRMVAWGMLWPVGGLESASPSGLLRQELSSWKLPDAWRHIGMAEESLSISFTDSAHLYLSLYYALTLQRIRQGHAVQLQPDQVTFLNAHPEVQVLHEVMEKLVVETGLRWPPEEIGQFTLEVITSARQSGHEPLVLRESPILDIDVTAFVRRLVSDIENEVAASLAHPEVLTRMEEHLSRAITRLRYGMPIANPLTDQVRQTYPTLWLATAKAVERLQSEFDLTFPPEEVGFLTMYMGLALDITQREHKTMPRVVVACPSGGVTVWMLVSRLRSELPEIEIVDVVPVRHLNRISSTQADAIVTTAAIQSTTLPVITVSPFISQQEVIRIRKQLGLNGDSRASVKPR